MADKEMYILRNWSMIIVDNKQKLHGKVFQHPQYIEGTEITTSSIVGFEILNDEDVVVETRNSQYLLKGDPDPEYDKTMGYKAKERMQIRAEHDTIERKRNVN